MSKLKILMDEARDAKIRYIHCPKECNRKDVQQAVRTLRELVDRMVEQGELQRVVVEIDSCLQAVRDVPPGVVVEIRDFNVSELLDAELEGLRESDGCKYVSGVFPGPAPKSRADKFRAMVLNWSDDQVEAFLSDIDTLDDFQANNTDWTVEDEICDGPPPADWCPSALKKKWKTECERFTAMVDTDAEETDEYSALKDLLVNNTAQGSVTMASIRLRDVVDAGQGYEFVRKPTKKKGDK